MEGVYQESRPRPESTTTDSRPDVYIPTSEPLSLLEFKAVQPVENANEFRTLPWDPLGKEFSFAEPKPRLSEAESLSQEVVARIAIDWLVSHFGSLSRGMEYEVTKINAESFNKEAIVATNKVAVELRILFDGKPTPLTSKIEFKNRNISGIVRTGSLATIADTKQKTLSKEQAVGTLVGYYNARGMTDSQRQELEGRLGPSLEFVWSPVRKKDAQRRLDLEYPFAPTWVMTKDRRLMVDAHTGEVWLDR
jgi:hypothetical protein